MREAVYYWKNGAPVYHDVERDHGYLVVTGGGEQYFDEAAAAMRFSAFMEELGYDAVYYDCQIIKGLILFGHAYLGISTNVV